MRTSAVGGEKKLVRPALAELAAAILSAGRSLVLSVVPGGASGATSDQIVGGGVAIRRLSVETVFPSGYVIVRSLFGAVVRR